ncbi:MAG: hypothetical protein JXB32_18685 [Deltaproteobacteria bacterium]|nr:hypothetical protein [Deltaproteobacteria bacterium]
MSEQASTRNDPPEPGGALQERPTSSTSEAERFRSFYDALTSDRCYRPAFDHDRSCGMIREGRGTQFDPQVVAAFEDVAGPFRRIRAELGGDGTA